MSAGPSQLEALGALLDKVAKKQKVDTVPRQLDQMLAILDDWEVRCEQAQGHTCTRAGRTILPQCCQVAAG